MTHARALGSTALLLCATALTGCGATDDGRDSDSAVPGGAGRPVLDLTSVPPLSSSDNLTGRAWHVRPAKHRVAVYIRVAGNWWTKPTAASPYTALKSNGAWTCDITSGGADPTAGKIAAFLVASTYSPPVLLGAASLRPELYQLSKASVEFTRMASANFRTLAFSGYEWAVKQSSGPVGPGPNLFSDSGENVCLDKSGRLHLKITHDAGGWRCAEVVLRSNLGYGAYAFTLGSFVDALDRNAVLGLFTWDDHPEQAHRELDIEFSRWSDPSNRNAQYVVQPYTNPAHMHRFDMPHVAPSTHQFNWRAGKVVFRSTEGTTTAGSIIEHWTYAASDVPSPGQENARLNLWLTGGQPPLNGQPIQVIISRFRHRP